MISIKSEALNNETNRIHAEILLRVMDKVRIHWTSIKIQSKSICHISQTESLCAVRKVTNFSGIQQYLI